MMKQKLILLSALFLLFFNIEVQAKSQVVRDLKDLKIENPCLEQRIDLVNGLKNRDVYFEKVSLDNNDMFLIFNYDKEGYRCVERRHDIFFKVGNHYIYNDQLLNDFIDEIIEIRSSQKHFIVHVEYGNGTQNHEDLYLKVANGNVYLTKLKLVYSRYGKKQKKVNPINIKNIQFWDVMNRY